MNKILLPIHSENENFTASDSALEKIIMRSNQLAMQNLEQNKSNHVLFYLNQCLLSCKQMQNSEFQNRLMALTYNNLACYFQSIKNSAKALEFLFKAVNLLSASKDIINLSASHLNICSILATLGEHERALRHALKSIYLLRAREKFSVTLVKAYLASGNQYKIMNQDKDALECFEKGLSLSKSHLVAGHSLTVLLQSALNSYKITEFSKQKTSGMLKKYTPILHTRQKSNFESKLLKKIQVDKSLNKSVDRYKVVQKKNFNSDRVDSADQKNGKKFDILQQRMQEKLAAIFIQAWWRGIRARKVLETWRIEKEIQEAEEKARKAAEYAQNLKAKAALKLSPRKDCRVLANKNKAAIKIQKNFKLYLARKKRARLSKATSLIKNFIISIHSKSFINYT